MRECLERLKEERYGKNRGQYDSIFNLSGLELSTLVKEILNRGLEFGVPQKVRREDVLAEF